MNTDNNTPENDRKVVQRSAAYPNITIEEALSFVTELKASLQNRLFNREDIIAVLKRTNINRDVAAAVQYGLLEKTTGEGYKVSQTAQYIINPVTDEERDDNIIECFKKPKLYSELIEKFKGQALPPDERFKAILIRFHNITEAAAGQAADIFIQNARYTGLLNNQRVLSDNKSNDGLLKIGSPKEEHPSEPIVNTSQDDVTTEAVIPLPPAVNADNNKQMLLLEEMNGKVEIVIRLTERKSARLVYPDSINEKDVQILKLQLEQIALTLDL